MNDEKTEPNNAIPLNLDRKTEPCPPPVIAQLLCWKRVGDGGGSPSHAYEPLAWIVTDEQGLELLKTELPFDGFLSIQDPSPADADAFLNNLLMRTKGVTHG